MHVLKFSPTKNFGSNMYILISNGEGAVIDPSVSYFDVKKALDAEAIILKYVIITHSHFDHFLEVDSWMNNTEANLIVSRTDAPALSDSYLNCYSTFLGLNRGYFGSYKTVDSDDAIALADKTLSIIETPGHTAGAIAIYTDGLLFVGDTVFADGSVGRVDLPGGSYSQILTSVKRLLDFPDETVIYSGHGPQTTIKELKSNLI